MNRPRLTGLTSFLRQQRPTPTPETQQVQIAPSPTPEPDLNQIAIPPSPTPPSSRLPTPTPQSISIAPTATATERVPTPTSLPERVPLEPTATQAVIAESEPDEPLEQQFPCGSPGNPFGWLCWPGPGGPWFPVFPSGAATDATGIAWYGIRMTDPFARDGWGMDSVSWTLDGQEVSRCTMEANGGSHRWLLSDARTQVDLSFSVMVDVDRRGEIAGQLNGRAWEYPIGDGVRSSDAVTHLELDDAEASLVARWVPLVYDLDGLLDIAAPGDGGAVESPGKCAVAGGLTITGCLATAGFAIFGVVVCDDIVDAAVDWCTD